MQTTAAHHNGNPLVGELTPGRLGENTAVAPGGHMSTSAPTNYTSGTSTGTTTTSTTSHSSGITNGMNGLGLNGNGHTGTMDKATHGTPSTTHTSSAGTTAGQHSHSHSHGVTDTTTTGSGTRLAEGTPSQGPKDFSRASGVPNQEVCGNHLVPGMENIGTGYSGPAAKRGDISAPTGSLPAGTIEKGATNQPIPRPSPKDFFKMSNASTPASPQALANRPVHQDPISEADHVPPTHGGHSGTPGNMASSTPSVHKEGIDPYAAASHGDHLAHGVNAGTGYAGAGAARGDISAPTGSLPPGTIEAGAQNQAIPRPSAKDHFLINNSASPSNPVSLAKRMFKDGLGIGKAPTDSK